MVSFSGDDAGSRAWRREQMEISNDVKTQKTMSTQARTVVEHSQKTMASLARTRRSTSLVRDVRVLEYEQSGPRAVSAVRGLMTVGPEGPLVPFESELERRFLVIARLDRRVTSVRAQPFSLLFDETASGKARRYTPDFLVHFAANGELPFKELLVEVKARRDLFRARRRLRAPMAAAQVWADQAFGRAFHVITDVRMATGSWLHNAEILSAHLDRQYELAFLEQCLSLLAHDREARLETLLQRAQQRNLNHKAVLSALYHLIARRVLDVELGVPISYSSWLRLNEAAQQRPGPEAGGF